MSPLRHAAAVVGGYTLLFSWLFSRTLFGDGYPAESDLYEYFLPIFLSPITTWSSFEFGGAPAFADPGEPTAYLPFLFFARIAGSWTAYIVSAYVIAASGAYAYTYAITRSRLAAAAAGLAFGLSEAMVERIAHLGVVHTIAWFPLVLLAIDRLRGEARGRWIGLGALVLATSFLAGNPQTFLYAGYAAGLYGLVGGIAERAGWRYYAAGLAMAGLGGLMTAVKALPVLEAAEYTARQTVNFGQFVGFSNTPLQMLSIVVPAIVHEGREAPTYVGLATLVFALAALARIGANWRVGFWLAATIVALMLGAGDATPLARLAYEVPFYDRFRVVGRHLFLAAFGLAALAGIGIAGVRQESIRARWLISGLAAVMLAVAATAAAFAVWPGRFALDPIGGLPWRLPVWTPTVWGQLVIALLTIGATLAFARRPRHAGTAGMLAAVLAVDLLCGIAYLIDVRGFQYYTLPGAAVGPSVHAAALRERLSAAHQRLLSPAGTHVDDIAPAAFARLWQLPIAGGYGPMLIDAYAQFAMMGTNGSVDPVLLADANRALDLMAVRFVVLPAAELETSGTIERDGIAWAAEPMSLPVGPWECGQRYPRSASYALPADVRVTAVLLNARLKCSEDVPQGAEAGVLEVHDANGVVARVPLRAGIELADEGLSDPGVRGRARHEPAAIFDEAESPYSYVARIDLPRPAGGARLEFSLTGTAGSMAIERLSVIDDQGRTLPQTAPRVFVDDARRWRLAGRIATSRVTDRGSDGSREGEREYVILENSRALPRAWMTSETLSVSPEEADLALHHSLLPDGRRFDPAAMALVEAGAPPKRYDTGASIVQVRSIRDGAISVRVSTEGGGFLVLSETYYPGWRASIDGGPVDLVRANAALQGVEVPAGIHAVDFEFAPATLVTGRTLSALGLAGAIALAAWPRRPRRHGMVRKPA